MSIRAFPSVCPDNEIEGEYAPTVGALQFGDGYLHRQVDGINAQKRTWTLSFQNLYEGEYLLVKNFIESTRGAEAFLYRFIYDDKARLVVAMEGYNDVQKSGGFFDISFVIQEVYDGYDSTLPVEVVFPYLDMVIGSDMDVNVKYSHGNLTGAVVTVHEAFPAQLKQAQVEVTQPSELGECIIHFKASQTQHLLSGQLNWFRLKAEYPIEGIVDVTPKIGINGK